MLYDNEEKRRSIGASFFIHHIFTTVLYFALQSSIVYCFNVLCAMLLSLIITHFGWENGWLSGDIVCVKKPVIFIFYLVMLVVITGCENVSLPVTSNSTEWSSQYLNVIPECSSSSSSPPYDCQFLVTIGPFKKDEMVDVKLHADYGVDFARGEHFQHEITDAERTSVVKDVDLQQHGTRVIHFPFTYDRQSQLLLAGEYIVIVQLIEKGVDGEILIIDELSAKVFIGNDYAEDRAKGNSLMYGQSDFNKEYAQLYTEGEHAIYLLYLESGVHPTEGNVFVKVVGRHDNYDPVVTIHSNGGVEFKNIAPLFLCMDVEGSRIINFPFRIVEGTYQSDGRYMLSISIQEDGVTAVHEILPAALKLHSEPNTHQEQWLEIVSGIPDLPVATPAIAHTDDNRMPTAQIDSPLTGYSQTMSTGNHMALENNPQVYGLGGVPQYCDLPASPTPATKNQPELNNNVHAVRAILGGDPLVGNDPNASGGVGGQAPSSVVNMEQVQIDVPIGGNPNTDPACASWQYPFSVDANGVELLDTYLNYVKGKGTNMELTHFAEIFWACNDIEKDAAVLQAETIYYLPNGSSP